MAGPHLSALGLQATTVEEHGLYPAYEEEDHLLPPHPGDRDGEPKWFVNGLNGL